MNKNKITIITGGHDSGHITEMLKIIKGKNVFFADEYNLWDPCSFSSLNKNIDYIIIYDSILKNTPERFFEQKLWVEPNGKKGYYIKTPDVIIITEHLRKQNYELYVENRVEFIELFNIINYLFD